MTTNPPIRPVTRSVDHALAELPRAALVALPAELVEGKKREIVRRDGKTLGSVEFEPRLLRVYVPDGHGKRVRIPVTNTRDISKAVTALMEVDARHTRKSREGPEVTG